MYTCVCVCVYVASPFLYVWFTTVHDTCIVKTNKKAAIFVDYRIHVTPMKVISRDYIPKSV